MSWLDQVIGYGTHAARPAAGSAGRLYYETDTAALFRDSGTAWVALPLGSGSPALVKLDEIYLASAAASTFHFSSIDPGYNVLRLVVRCTTTDNDDSTYNRVIAYFNSDTTSTNYGLSELYSSGTGGSGGGGLWGQTGAILMSVAGTANAQPLLQDVATLEIPGYADTHIQKAGLYHYSYHKGGDHGVDVGKIHWLDTSGINDILLTLQRGQFAQYSKATLYGIV